MLGPRSRTPSAMPTNLSLTSSSQAYVQLAQRQLPAATIVLRSTARASVLPAVREAIWAEFPDLPLPDQTAPDEQPFVASIGGLEYRVFERSRQQRRLLRAQDAHR